MRQSDEVDTVEGVPFLRTRGKRGGRKEAVLGVALGVALFTAIAIMVIGIALVFSQSNDYPAPVRSKDAVLSFLVVGDWGFGSARHQPESARFMGELSNTLRPDFVISTGDNMYPNGMKGQNDPKFRERFSHMYSAKGLQVPWYSVLGNHDYGDGSQVGDEFMQCKATSIDKCETSSCCPSPEWQMTPRLNSLDSRWHCSNGTHKMTLLGGDLDLVFIDTTPYIGRHRTAVWADNPGGLLSQNTTAQTAHMSQLLDQSSQGKAKWRLVVGHHAVRSYGGHCSNTSSPSNDCNAMSWLMPYLQKARVQLYLNGHDHDLQHIKFPNETTHFVTSGGGGDFRRGEFDNNPNKDHAQFLEDGLGFAAVEVFPDVLTVTFYTVRAGRRPAHVLQIWDGGAKHKRARRLRERAVML